MVCSTQNRPPPPDLHATISGGSTVNASLIIAMILGSLLAPGGKAKQWGNASCSGYRHMPPHPKADRSNQDKAYCDFLIGDPHRPVALKRKFIPNGERLLVLGRSVALEGYDHGDSWIKSKPETGLPVM